MPIIRNGSNPSAVGQAAYFTGSARIVTSSLGWTADARDGASVEWAEHASYERYLAGEFIPARETRS